MSLNQNLPVDSETPSAPYRPGTGEDRYVRFARDWLGLRIGDFQDKLLRALESNRRVVAVAANGVGKSFGGGAAGGIAALFCNPNTTVNITSGSYGQLDDSIWKPLKSLHRKSGLPGRTLDNTRELRTGIDEEWYLKCLSPRNPGDLEGRHNDRMVYIIEEADKPGVTHDHIDSAESTLTDTEDRMLVIANPPEDETNVVYELMQSNGWTTIQFSSLDGHNVRVDAGEIEGEKIPGLVELSEVRENWENWNNREWPGLEAARNTHTDTSLDRRWFRRRLGRIPPQSASAHRPFTVADVEAAFSRAPQNVSETPDGIGLDVARMGGDHNALAGVFGDELRVLDYWNDLDHTENESRVRTHLGDEWDATFAVDSTPEGSGLADRIKTFYPALERYQNQRDAVDASAYKDCWAEGLDHLGDFLASAGTISDRRLREELLAASRTIEYEEKFYSSRDSTVLKATSKSKVKDVLGRSPDLLDAAMMAVWAATVETSRRERPDHHGVRSLG